MVNQARWLIRHRGRQTELPQDGAIGEAGDARHQVAVEGEHEQAVCAGDAFHRVAQVAAERRLAICPGSDQAEAAGSVDELP